MISNGPRCEKTRLWGFANNKGSDQPAASAQSDHGLYYSLFGMYHIKVKDATSEISVF